MDLVDWSRVKRGALVLIRLESGRQFYGKFHRVGCCGSGKDKLLCSMMHTDGERAIDPGDVELAGRAQKMNESKYMTVCGALVNKATGSVIPVDEPVFILRAQDTSAAVTLLAYLDSCDVAGVTPEFKDSLLATIQKFEQWGATHSDKMKTPD